jgi:hypothetical protein
MILSRAGLSLQDANLHCQLIDSALRVFNGCRRGCLANGHLSASGIEYADRFVRKLPAGNVAVRQSHGVFHGLIQNAHFVVVLERLNQPAHHDNSCSSVGSLTFTTWKRRAKAASFRNILYSAQVVAASVRSSPRASAGFQEVGRTFGLPAACAIGGVGFIDEQDDGLGRSLHFADDGL